MFDPAFWALFFAAALVINLTPGPDMLYWLGKSCVQGRRIGLWAAAGLWCGTLFHVSAAAVGLSALLVASSTLFTLVKLLGAAYLCWLGIQALRNAGSGLAPRAAAKGPVSGWATFRQGVLIDVLNPKTALFFMAFLPQFVRPELADVWPVWAQLAVLGCLVTLVAVPVELALILCASRMTLWLRSRENVARWLDRLLGAMFIGLGVRLLTAGQRS
ncbi:LysE family translocator [Halotalea alkalilenta]|uniref:LysE family translocator n=1 Tax=Halotalea alkalilenta TaxID=376489 RepID=UPI00048746E9|nr:LysE family translocator [Halotalea alkalilenta]